jgi:hypothetical protein
VFLLSEHCLESKTSLQRIILLEFKSNLHITQKNTYNLVPISATDHLQIIHQILTALPGSLQTFGQTIIRRLTRRSESTVEIRPVVTSYIRNVTLSYFGQAARTQITFGWGDT